MRLPKWILILIIFIFLVLIFIKNISPKQRPLSKANYSQISITSLPQNKLSAWLAWWDGEQTIISLNKAKEKLTFISPAWYKLSSQGVLETIPIAKAEEINRIARVASLSIVPTIGNDFDSKRVEKFLQSSTLKNQFMTALIQIAKDKKYQGFDIDWEQINVSRKDAFNDFIKELSTKLHEQNLILTISVHARTGEASDWELAKTFDWKKLSSYADQIRIMAYDFHNEETQPGAITPKNSLKAVLKYAKTTIPEEKIVLGLPDYGYDWQADKGKSITYKDASNLIKTYNGTWTRDKESQELIGKYKIKGVSHTIWMADKKAVLEKIKIGRDFGVYQFCLWRLGDEDLSIWD